MHVLSQETIQVAIYVIAGDLDSQGLVKDGK